MKLPKTTVLAGSILAGSTLMSWGLLPGSATAASTAKAASVVCDEHVDVSYNPPLTDTPQTTTKSIKITFSNCSAVGDAAVVPTSAQGTQTAQGDCSGTVTTSGGSGTISWSDGTTGRFSVTRKITSEESGDGKVKVEGRIEGPHYDGATFNADTATEGTCPQNAAEADGTFTINS
uniref:Uncharacterized protein n=1 Tax=Streptomyces sp. WT6 TaxID=1486372 RepID=A0A023PZT3_9ACTN|nr:hypothetical protein wt6.35 [Streptomyces sp. WT6]